jgi:branched-chain amino acid transport system permease protein
MAVATAPTETLPAIHEEFRPTVRGLVARGIAALGLIGLVLLTPVWAVNAWDDRISKAAIYAVIGLSMNIITGYAGQISLGHQAFVGIGAFTSAYVVGPKLGQSFFLAVVVAGGMGALLSFGLGLIALRIRGLYLALITLAFGLVAQQTIFNIRGFAGGAGAEAPRPSLFQSNQAYAYLCFMFLALFLMVDWRLARTKAGRAIVAVRNNERVAATLGINVTSYKLMAFVVGGFVAGVAGSLLGHLTQFVYAADFDFQAVALLWVIMAVVGGLGSRAGVVVGSAFFALFPDILRIVRDAVGWKVQVESLAIYGLLFGSILLLITLTLYPGGIGQQLLPYRRWLAGGRLFEDRHETIEVPLQMGFVALVVSLILGASILPAVIAAAITQAVCTGLAIWHVTRNRPDLKRHGRTKGAVAEAAEEEEEEEEEPVEVEAPIFAGEPEGGEVAEPDGEPETDQTTRIPAVSGPPGPAGRGLRAFRRRRGSP